MHWRRWLLLLVGLPLYAGAMAWLSTAILFVVALAGERDELLEALALLVSPHRWELHEEEMLIAIGAPTAILLATQAMFILPIFKPRPLQYGRSKSLRLSLAMAAMVAAVLTCGLGFAVLGLVQLLRSLAPDGPDPADAVDFPGRDWWFLAGLIAAFGVSWIFWSVVMFIHARRVKGFGALRRVVGLLLGGTIVEVILVLPLDVMLRRRTDCYCGVGTFWTLCLSGWALLWLTGPGAVLALTHSRRRAWYQTNCAMCGYEKGPTPAARCPECGFAWDAAGLTRKDRAEDSPAR